MGYWVTLPTGGSVGSKVEQNAGTTPDWRGRGRHFIGQDDLASFPTPLVHLETRWSSTRHAQFTIRNRWSLRPLQTMCILDVKEPAMGVDEYQRFERRILLCYFERR